MVVGKEGRKGTELVVTPLHLYTRDWFRPNRSIVPEPTLMTNEGGGHVSDAQVWHPSMCDMCDEDADMFTDNKRARFLIRSMEMHQAR